MRIEGRIEDQIWGQISNKVWNMIRNPIRISFWGQRDWRASQELLRVHKRVEDQVTRQVIDQVREDIDAQRQRD
jgi:hypothetical protein